MASKTLNTRFVQKNDTSANWAKATNFTPLKGEIIVYTDLKKFKIGDGVTTVGNLEFSNAKDAETLMGASLSTVLNSSDTEIPTSKAVSDSLKSFLLIGNGGNGLPSAKDWRSIAYGNGVFVVVSNTSMNYAYSNNGTVWTEFTLPTTGAYNTVTFGNGKFIIPVPNSTKIYYSTNGQSWSTAQAPVSANWTCSCYAADKFVILSNGTDVIYSSDGVTWTASTLPVSGNWVDVTYDTPHSRFSAVGQDSSNAIYSSDGITWSKSTLPLSAKWTCVASNSDKVIALNSGSDSEAYSNSGGFIWMKSNAPKNTTWSSMCYGDGKLVAIAKGSTDAAYSTDGTNWTLTTMPQSANWCDVIYDGTKFIAIASNETSVAYSDNGMTWESGGGIIQTNSGEDVTESIKTILGIGGTSTETLSLPTDSWTGTESPYSQVVTLSNVTANSKVDLQPTPTQLASLADNETILNTANDNGTVTVYAIGNKPTEDYTMQATITEV